METHGRGPTGRQAPDAMSLLHCVRKWTPWTAQHCILMCEVCSLNPGTLQGDPNVIWDMPPAPGAEFQAAWEEAMDEALRTCHVARQALRGGNRPRTSVIETLRRTGESMWYIMSTLFSRKQALDMQKRAKRDGILVALQAGEDDRAWKLLEEHIMYFTELVNGPEVAADGLLSEGWDHDMMDNLTLQDLQLMLLKQMELTRNRKVQHTLISDNAVGEGQ